ncbi:zinc finger protein 284-like [Onthophagus taurus]|uniref:zinc finger protein 284-like n=1 Tax=Onthophagus taurus TaxID=166361 RepID=UPI0039BEA9A8
MGSEHYCLRWNNHQSNLLGVFSQLLRDESLVDVTLACSEGHSIRAHKVVLSACSSYFQNLFVDHPSRHPIVILKDVRFAELRTLVDFMYKGEVNVEYCQLSALLKTAESLKVKGLAEMTNLGPTRDYDKGGVPEPEQLEPTELVNKRVMMTEESSSSSRPDRPDRSERIDRIERLDRMERIERISERMERISDRLESSNREQQIQTPPAKIPKNSSPERPESVEGDRSESPAEECRPSDMSMHNNGNNVSCTTTSATVGTPCNRIPSPINSEPLPGPSNLPPVQQVPLSLTKEADWVPGLSEEKSAGESSSDYPRHPHDTPIEIDRCFTSPSCLDRPQSAHSSRSSTPFALPFPTLATSLLEVGLMHPALLGEEMFRCSACMAAFPSIWLLEQHTALQHIGALGSIDKPFVCEQCGQSYRYRSAYVKHREQNHRARLPADKLFSCDVCGMQFRYLKSFKKHRLNHALERLHGKTNPDSQSSDSKPGQTSSIQPDNSDQVSSSNETLAIEDAEETITIKKEPSSDNDATQEANSSDVDKNDPDQDQDDTIDSMVGFPRPTSSTASSTSEAYRNAQEASIISFLRADAAERQRERRFACPFCGKCVRSKENLKLHVRKHTGERPFVCLFCGRAFGGKSDLTRHLRIHTGERPYHCDSCGKCFARADYLSKHLTTHLNSPR